MGEVITIGVDLAKNVFQVHGVDSDGKVAVRRQLRRSQVMLFFRNRGSGKPDLARALTQARAYDWDLTHVDRIRASGR